MNGHYSGSSKLVEFWVWQFMFTDDKKLAETQQKTKTKKPEAKSTLRNVPGELRLGSVADFTTVRNAECRSSEQLFALPGSRSLAQLVYRSHG